MPGCNLLAVQGVFQAEGVENMDKEAAARLVEDYGDMVLRLALAKTGNRHDAEDVTQEVFLRLLRKGPERFDNEDHAKHWLLRVTLQRSNDLFRKRSRLRELPLEAAEHAGTPAREETGDTLAAVMELPEDLRVAVHLYYYEGLSIAQTAKTLGKSEGAVKTRLSRARSKLRELLTKGDEELV